MSVQNKLKLFGARYLFESAYQHSPGFHKVPQPVSQLIYSLLLKMREAWLPVKPVYSTIKVFPTLEYGYGECECLGKRRERREGEVTMKLLPLNKKLL